MASATFEDHPTDPNKVILRKKPHLDKGRDYEEGFVDGMQHQMQSSVDKAVNAMAQPEQEPVTWGVDWGKAGDIPCVSIIKRLPDGGIEVVAVEYAPYSYTTPPQRKPLTDEEIGEVAVKSQDGISPHDDTLRFARAIEAKLKEKNT